ncbi:hypothetical protein EYF80_041168 [Liparis tanakae]|uniref:Uncharacterized protein n=1 Tax=Liparis tanakae TaxID=230148 RepID=A0A4Z2G657_9TELE|nr:hypothetical protein EYF80_041168 [Liparis tanakae]
MTSTKSQFTSKNTQLTVQVAPSPPGKYLASLRATSSAVGSRGLSLASARMAAIFWTQSERFLC